MVALGGVKQAYMGDNWSWEFNSQLVANLEIRSPSAFTNYKLLPTNYLRNFLSSVRNTPSQAQYRLTPGIQRVPPA